MLNPFDSELTHAKSRLRFLVKFSVFSALFATFTFDGAYDYVIKDQVDYEITFYLFLVSVLNILLSTYSLYHTAKEYQQLKEN
ncbi:hypothetical protein [Marinomonas aquiplantarum]|uniref:Uncharacterized protein n=1 Tax=Marinomonas aquiplantarum TaxID=491951 RepID=A0A366DA30_9GAMM|nr:hypothetical protein [Marinomonas aquiplantarum]RBO86118.1 hypothetical protein DFP76_101394 [Marinomonas aquiplantarum]